MQTQTAQRAKRAILAAAMVGALGGSVASAGWTFALGGGAGGVRTAVAGGVAESTPVAPAPEGRIRSI
jgi:hypothetical protein